MNDPFGIGGMGGSGIGGRAVEVKFEQVGALHETGTARP
jgi:hypothetical protein